MKKMFVFCLIAIMLCSVCMAGCSTGEEANTTPKSDVTSSNNPPQKENNTIGTADEYQYVRDGKLYLSEAYVFHFTSTDNGESRPGHGLKSDFLAAVIKQLAEYKKSDDIHNDKIEQCILEMVVLDIVSPDDMFHLKNGDTVVWEATIKQDILDEFNSYINGIEIVVDSTYTVTVEGLTE